MSQEKVDRYKAAKNNRKEEVRKAKAQRVAWRVGTAAIICGILAWFGISAYNSYQSAQPRDSVAVDMSAVTEYAGSLSEDAE